mmetsp:Transcript_46136/g.128331  ORF Transcript_46136/g.128331 Transcript_46136/m.128331 type:complete len:245 (-) Transcript_46136:996-1730(-)
MANNCAIFSMSGGMGLRACCASKRNSLICNFSSRSDSADWMRMGRLRPASSRSSRLMYSSSCTNCCLSRFMLATFSSSLSISSLSFELSLARSVMLSLTFLISALNEFFSSSWPSMRLAKNAFSVCSWLTFSFTVDISFSALSCACCDAVTRSSIVRFFFFNKLDSCSASLHSSSAKTLASVSMLIFAFCCWIWRSSDRIFFSLALFSASCFVSSTWFKRSESINAYTLSAVSRERSPAVRFSS